MRKAIDFKRAIKILAEQAAKEPHCQLLMEHPSPRIWTESERKIDKLLTAMEIEIGEQENPEVIEFVKPGLTQDAQDKFARSCNLTPLEKEAHEEFNAWFTTDNRVALLIDLFKSDEADVNYARDMIRLGVEESLNRIAKKRARD